MANDNVVPERETELEETRTGNYRWLGIPVAQIADKSNGPHRTKDPIRRLFDWWVA